MLTSGPDRRVSLIAHRSAMARVINKTPGCFGSAGKRLNRLYGLRRKLKVEAGQILPHVLGVGGARQRQHADATREREHYLRGRSVGLPGQAIDKRMAEHFDIRGEKREALINNLVLLAE